MGQNQASSIDRPGLCVICLIQDLFYRCTKSSQSSPERDQLFSHIDKKKSRVYYCRTLKNLVIQRTLSCSLLGDYLP